MSSQHPTPIEEMVPLFLVRLEAVKAKKEALRLMIIKAFTMST